MLGGGSSVAAVEGLRPEVDAVIRSILAALLARKVRGLGARIRVSWRGSSVLAALHHPGKRNPIGLIAMALLLAAVSRYATLPPSPRSSHPLPPSPGHHPCSSEREEGPRSRSSCPPSQTRRPELAHPRRRRCLPLLCTASLRASSTLDLSPDRRTVRLPLGDPQRQLGVRRERRERRLVRPPPVLDASAGQIRVGVCSQGQEDCSPEGLHHL